MRLFLDDEGDVLRGDRLALDLLVAGALELDPRALLVPGDDLDLENFVLLRKIVSLFLPEGTYVAAVEQPSPVHVSPE